MSDLRFALRTLSKSQGFTLTAIGLLAAGIGSNTLIFSALDALLLRPLPVRDPGGLVRMVQRIPRVGTQSRFHYSLYLALRDHSTTLSAVFGEMADNVAMTEPAPAERIRVHLSTPEFFEALGVPAAYGRTLVPDDSRENPGMPPAVLSYAFWQRRFDGSPAVIGKTLTLHGQRFVIIGVTPRGFNGVAADTAPDVRVPLRSAPLLSSFPVELYLKSVGLDLGGRLKPGVTLAQARAECQALRQADAEQYSTKLVWLGDEVQYRLDLDPLERGFSVLRDRYSSAVKFLIASVALLLLIACANVAGLLLARGAARRQEIAVRLAVGATRVRLVRQMLVESLLLAMAGSIGGLLIAVSLTPMVAGALPPIHDLGANRLAVSLGLAVDRRVLLFSLIVSALTVLLFGLAPAIAASRTSLDSVMRGARASGGWKGRQLLIVFQIALCTALLAGAGLLVRTFEQLHGMDPGFDRDHVVTFTLDPALSGYSEAQRSVLAQGLAQRIRELPRVTSVGFAGRGVMRDRGLGATVAPVGQSSAQADLLNADMNQVSPEYFDTMGIRILAGRAFLRSDDPKAKPMLVVVNQTFTRRFFPGVDPIGKRFGIGAPGTIGEAAFEIVGVANDAKYRFLREAIHPTFYLHAPDSFWSVMHVRTQGRPEELIQPVRRTLAALDPALPFTEIDTLAEEVDASSSGERLTAALASAFGALAALLTAVAIYGLLAYAVVLRRREIGIRMALGARPADITVLLGRQILAMVTGGVVMGLSAAALVTPLVRSLLYGIAPSDPKSFAAAAALVFAIASIATIVPFARAARVQPAAALRQEN